MIHDIALGLGAAITGIVISSFAGVLFGRFFAVANAQEHRRMSQEQASRDGQSDRLGGVSDGAEIDNFHTTLV